MTLLLLWNTINENGQHDRLSSEDRRVLSGNFWYAINIDRPPNVFVPVVGRYSHFRYYRAVCVHDFQFLPIFHPTASKRVLVIRLFIVARPGLPWSCHVQGHIHQFRWVFAFCCPCFCVDKWTSTNTNTSTWTSLHVYLPLLFKCCIDLQWMWLRWPQLRQNAQFYSLFPCYRFGRTFNNSWHRVTERLWIALFGCFDVMVTVGCADCSQWPPLLAYDTR